MRRSADRQWGHVRCRCVSGVENDWSARCGGCGRRCDGRSRRRDDRSGRCDDRSARCIADNSSTLIRSRRLLRLDRQRRWRRARCVGCGFRLLGPSGRHHAREARCSDRTAKCADANVRCARRSPRRVRRSPRFGPECQRCGAECRRSAVDCHRRAAVVGRLP
jgi:hypothetical protein